MLKNKVGSHENGENWQKEKRELYGHDQMSK